jgi:hypothetical protein
MDPFNKFVMATIGCGVSKRYNTDKCSSNKTKTQNDETTNTFPYYYEGNAKKFGKVYTYYTRSIQQTVGERKLLHIL